MIEKVSFNVVLLGKSPRAQNRIGNPINIIVLGIRLYLCISSFIINPKKQLPELIFPVKWL